jgi:outer membrane protein
MKKVFVGVAVIFCMMAMWSLNIEASESSSNFKIGYVDLNAALNEVNEGKTAKSKLEADGKAKKQKLEIMQNDVKKIKEDIDKQRLILSAEALREKEMQLQQKFLELQKMTIEFERDFAEKETSYIRPISEKLQIVISDIGKEEGYAIIVPKEMALYSLPGADLTQKVVAAYNKKK